MIKQQFMSSLCSSCSLPRIYLYSKDMQVSVIKETKLPLGVAGLCVRG